MIAFVPLPEAALEQVLRWRTAPDVTRYLKTDLPFDLARQEEWYSRVKEDPRCEHWLVMQDDVPVGLAYLADIDRAAGVCSCGFYIGEPAARRLGGAVLSGLVNHVFEVLGFRKIWGEVMAGNENVLKLHDLLGYRKVGTLTAHVFKYGQHHDLHLYELTRERWEAQRALFRPYRIPLLKTGRKEP